MHVPQVMKLCYESGPVFTKRTDVLPQDLVMSRGREIRV